MAFDGLGFTFFWVLRGEIEGYQSVWSLFRVFRGFPGKISDVLFLWQPETIGGDPLKNVKGFPYGKLSKKNPKNYRVEIPQANENDISIIY